MQLFKIIKVYILEIRNKRKILKVLKKADFKYNRMAAELIRNTHSIEKGLSISNPKLGFGHKKQEIMLNLINTLKNSESDYHKEVIKMALDALKEYIEFHNENNYKDAFTEKIEKYLSKNYKKNSIKYGGTITINNSDIQFNVEEIERFFKTRHSVRNFEKTENEVDEETLKKALELAKRAPSACNRQGVRAYVIGKDKFYLLKDWLEGIGGFSEDVDKYILITGKISSYRSDENYQYIVSASIYAAYLSLTLHLYGIGSCIIQRPVVFSKKWKELQNKLKIQEDEQIICLLGTGILKKEYKVPVSYRLENNEMIKFL